MATRKKSPPKLVDIDGNIVKPKPKPRKKQTNVKKKPSVKEPKVFIQHDDYEVFIPAKPVPKGRPRLGRRGRVFTPQTTLDAEAFIASCYAGPVYEGPVTLQFTFTPEGTTLKISSINTADTKVSKLRGDIDNYLKLLMDGLNGVAWHDDKQVYGITALKE